ncbi:MAG: dCMP deaminase family protein [Hyphomicrobiaceae bacterium]|nr:MAG: dCMP deaminase family protein [Hyphomicrobiaceae bacterium]
MSMQTKWDDRFLEMAELVSRWSKDPSTQCGAVITDSNHRVLGVGYNGFPRGVEDRPDRLNDRPTKYRMIIHAEVNAILNSISSVVGCTLYVIPLAPCSDCAKLVIQSGITRVVCPRMPVGKERWQESVELTKQMFSEAGVVLDEIDDSENNSLPSMRCC